MACFRLLCSGVRYRSDIRSDVRIRYRINITLFLLLLLKVMVCDLYFCWSHLLCLCITLILILYVICITCVYVREYYECPSLPTSHFSSCCCESTLSLCTPISILLLCYWISTSSCGCCLSLGLWSIGSWHTWHSGHACYWLSAFFIKSCIILLWELSRYSLG